MHADRIGTITTLTYMVRSLLALPQARRNSVVGSIAKPWCELLEQITRTMGHDLRPVVVPLLAEICRQADGLTPAQRALLGASARRVLAFAWGDAHRDRTMVRLGIEGVCRSFESDPTASGELLRRILAPEHLAAHGYDELPTLADELRRLLCLAPQFAEQVYCAAVAYREESDAAVKMGESQIMGFTSTKRQDYDVALHALGELFPQFMKAAPVHATGAVIAAVEAEVAKHTNSVEAIVCNVFRLGEVEARIAADMSHIWDTGASYGQQIHRQMLDGFEEGLVHLAANAGGEATLDQVLDRIARDNHFAAVWRRILFAATRAPGTLGLRILPVARAIPLLTGDDTVEPMGRYITAIFPRITPDERDAIERAILSIPTNNPETRKILIHRQDQLLGCLPIEYVMTERARIRLEELNAADGPPPNAPLFEIGAPTWQEYTEARWLAERGVSVDAQPNRRLLELSEPMGRFVEQFQVEGPTHEQANAVVPGLRELHQLLSRGGDGADSLIVDTACTRLAAACSALTKSRWLEQAAELAAFARSLLLEMSNHEHPTSNPDSDRLYEEHGALNSSPRLHAADGLLNLARFPTLADADVLAAIHRLAEDPRTEIRAKVAGNIHKLCRTAPDSLRSILRRIESQENSRRVVYYALLAVVPVARQFHEWTVPFAHTMFNRFIDDSGAHELRCACLQIVVRARTVDTEPYDDELIETVIGDVRRFMNEAVLLVLIAVDALAAGPTDTPDTAINRFRTASFAFCERMARTLLANTRELESRLYSVDPSDWPADARPQIAAIRRIAHQLAFRVQVVFDSTTERTEGHHARRAQMSDAAKRRFLQEGNTLLTLLADLAFPDVVHDLLQTLEAFVSVEPGTVFLMIVRAVRQGQSGGYQFESLGASLVVGLVRQYLADHRTLFRDDHNCRNALIEVLDTFVRAGWPEAIELTYRLEEIFR